MKKDTNTAVVAGKLTKDAEMKQEDMPVGFFTIANNRKKKDRNGVYVEEASYFDVNVYGKYAEAIIPSLKKDTVVCVSGSMKQERWTDRETGRNKSRVVITADAIQIFR